VGGYDLGIATWSGLPDLAPEDRLLLAELRRLGITAEGAVWDDPSVLWSGFRAVLIRSTWDSHLKRPAFLRWVARVSRRSRVWNPPEILRANTHKSYLRSLEAAGIPVVPTIWVRAGRRTDLMELVRRRGWTGFIVKPAVSADGYLTERFGPRDGEAARRHLKRVLAHSEAMVQPYLEALESTGERSLVYLDGRYSHAVRRARILDPDGRGTPEPSAPPPPGARELGDRTMGTVGGSTLYGRVDMVQDDRRRWRILELELTEPSLYLDRSAAAPRRFAEAIQRRLVSVPRSPEGR
jgi:hypothetical protein